MSHFTLKLYVAGMTPTAQRAWENLEDICETLKTRNTYTIEVIDIRKHPDIAVSEKIFATPTVVKHLPAPLRKVIGDLSDTEQALIGLALLD